MTNAMEFVTGKDVKPSLLIHDGLLVPVSAASLIDCEALVEYVRNATGLKCYFEIKPMTLTDDDFRWKDTVLKAFHDIQVAKSLAAASQDDFCKGLALVALESGDQKTVAKLFHGVFPDWFAYLGKRDGWFSLSAPRWWHIASDIEVINHLFNTQFCDKFQQGIATLEDESSPNESLIEKLTTIHNKNFSHVQYTQAVIKQL
jgi:hypothetical protein